MDNGENCLGKLSKFFKKQVGFINENKASANSASFQVNI